MRETELRLTALYESYITRDSDEGRIEEKYIHSTGRTGRAPSTDVKQKEYSIQ